MKQKPNVLVVGAGVVGLSTAVCLQERISSVNVTIFADKIGEDTLSSGAGGLYRPEITIDCNEKIVKKWCKDSLQHFLNICKLPNAGETGMQQVSGYHLSTKGKATLHNDLLKELLPVYRELSEKEMKLFPSHFKAGVFYNTVITDCRYYLPWLKQKFESAGGKIEIRHLENLSQVPKYFDIVVNCTGLGSRQLLNDKQLVPIRGQTIKVKAPWIKHFYYGDEVYVVPGIDYVTLGGVKDYGSWNTEVNTYQKQFIWDKCCELIPSLKNAEIMWDWTGLRPYRRSVCINGNLVYCNGKYLKVVNNYGHGAHGVTLSWGTAENATKIVKQLLQNNNDLLIAKL